MIGHLAHTKMPTAEMMIAMITEAMTIDNNDSNNDDDDSHNDDDDSNMDNSNHDEAADDIDNGCNYSDILHSSPSAFQPNKHPNIDTNDTDTNVAHACPTNPLANVVTHDDNAAITINGDNND